MNFLIFAGDGYYPLGGFNDFKEGFRADNLDVADATFATWREDHPNYDWYQLVRVIDTGLLLLGAK